MADRELNLYIRAKDKATGVFSKFGNFLKQKLVITLGDVARGMRNVVAGFGEMNRRAAEVEGVRQQFDSLTKSVGETSNAFLSKLRTATQGAVSDFALMKQANQALLLGLNLNSEQMGKLAAGALQLGKATGRTATEALGDLITGLGRQSKMILDNLGLVVDTTAAYENYAKTLGKTAETLTETERKAAFLTAGLAAMDERLSKVDKVAASGFERLSAQMENLRDAVGKSLTTSEDFNGAMNTLAAAVSDPKLISGLTTIVSAATKLAGLGVKGFSAVANAFSDIGKSYADMVIRLSGLDQSKIIPDVPPEKVAAVRAMVEETRRLNEESRKAREEEEAAKTAAVAAAAASQTKEAALRTQIDATTSLTDKINLLIEAEQTEKELAEGAADAITKAAAALGVQLEVTAKLAEEKRLANLQKQFDLLAKLNEETKGLVVTDLELLDARINLDRAMRGETIPALVDVTEKTREAARATREFAQEGRADVDTLSDSYGRLAESIGATADATNQLSGGGAPRSIHGGMLPTYGRRQSRWFSGLTTVY